MLLKVALQKYKYFLDVFLKGKKKLAKPTKTISQEMLINIRTRQSDTFISHQEHLLYRTPITGCFRQFKQLVITRERLLLSSGYIAKFTPHFL